jgi:formylglycine-generating enzyme required for sulfatase activity
MGVALTLCLPISRLPGDAELPSTLNVKDVEFVLVPAGEFEMGSTAEEAKEAFEDATLRSSMLEEHVFIAETPKHTVYLDAYYISKHPVTNAQYRAFVEATGRKPPYDTERKQHIWEQSDFSVPEQPVVGVTWFDAAAFCDWIGGQLPTEAQWEKAARGTDRRKYPWGNAPPNRKMAAYSKYVSHPVKVGSYPENVSPYGVMDMAGNVFEWRRDAYNTSFYRHSPSKNPVYISRGKNNREHVIRGGAFDYGTPFLRSALRMRLPADVAFRNLGFRVVYSPPK